MNSLISPRRSLRTALAVAALTAALGGSVAGCGGDDSTATGNPTQAPTATSGSTASSTSSDSGSNSEQAPASEPGEAATAPPEQPQPVPSGFPGPAAAPADARNKALLDELNKEGVQSSGNGENAVAIANFVCASLRDGSPQEQIDTTVTAMAGVELNLAGSKAKPEDAAKIYRDAAQKTYCK